MRKFAALFLAAAFCSVFVTGMWTSPVSSQGQQHPNTSAQSAKTGKITKSYRKQQSGARPAWVNDALARSLAHVNQNKAALGLASAETELTLLGADQDDLEMTHVRLDQVRNGVPVFGGQLITHLDATDTKSINRRKFNFTTGHAFADARQVNTVPTLQADQAIELAKKDLNYKGTLARSPEAELVILPETVKTGRENHGATLTWKVDLLIEDGTAATADHLYFVNARTGKVEWHYDNLKRQEAQCSDGTSTYGIGNTLYSGQRTLGTTYYWGTYYMLDRERGCMYVVDMHNGYYGGDIFTSYTNIWGNYSMSDPQTIGADAHFGAENQWDYLLNQGRRGIDGDGYQVVSHVHYGYGYNNAFWDGSSMWYGDGDGYWFGPFPSLDVVGHEITHGLTQFTANLYYGGESGGSNESFSDIFGEMVEAYARGSNDYKIGAEIYTPNYPGDALRYMYNPRADGASIDHYSQYYPGIDVHYSSGLQNIAFYLLAESGTHPTSGVTVKRIGREAAARVYFRALTLYLTAYSTFADVRYACELATNDFWNTGNPIFHATQKSWYASGVGSDVPSNPIDDAQTFVAQHYWDFLLRAPDQSGLDFWTSQITQCGNDAVCEDGHRVSPGSRSFWESSEFQNRSDVQASGLLTGNSAHPYDNHQFIRWCYKLYLQREPDTAGWAFWENQLNGHGDYNAIIRAFLLSWDYRGRFGPA